GELIARNGRVDRARRLVLVPPAPAGLRGVCAPVADLGQISDQIKPIGLSVPRDRGAVAQCRGARRADRAAWDWKATYEQLSTTRADQVIASVVREIGRWVYHLVSEEQRLLGGVGDRCYVADRVIAVCEILDGVVCSSRHEPDEPQAYAVVSRPRTRPGRR